MTWLWTAAVAAVMGVLAPRVLPRVALAESTRLGWAVPLAAALGAAVGFMDQPPALLAALAVVAGLAALLAVVDRYEHRLPDTLILAGLAVWLVGALVTSASTAEWEVLLRAVLAGLAAFAGFFVLALLAGGMLGFGDVKLVALLGGVLGWFGWRTLGQGLAFAVVLHGLAAVVVLIITRDRKADVPMGPALIAGAALALVVH